MNKEYVYKDGKALIIDENNNQKVADYYDNLDEVLEVENIIEIIENNIRKLEDELADYKPESKFSKFIMRFNPILICSIVMVLNYSLGKMYGLDKTIINTDLGIMSASNLITIVSVPCLTLSGVLMLLPSRMQRKIIKQEKNAKETQLNYLKKCLEEEKSHLSELKQVKTCNKESNSFYIAKIDNQEKLEKLDNFTAVCYDLGYNEDEYFKNYQKGNLDKRLKNKMNEDSIRFIEDHLKENESVLVKRRKNKKF